MIRAAEVDEVLDDHALGHSVDDLVCPSVVVAHVDAAMVPPAWNEPFIDETFKAADEYVPGQDQALHLSCGLSFDSIGFGVDCEPEGVQYTMPAYISEEAKNGGLEGVEHGKGSAFYVMECALGPFNPRFWVFDTSHSVDAGNSTAAIAGIANLADLI